MSAPTDRQPPRFVPTLTEVVKNTSPASTAAETAVSTSMPTASVTTIQEPTSTTPVPAPAMTEHIVQRVMARVEDLLQERLHEIWAEAIQAHTHALYQGLRNEVQSIVCQAVSDAIAQEMQPSPQTPTLRSEKNQGTQ